MAEVGTTLVARSPRVARSLWLALALVWMSGPKKGAGSLPQGGLCPEARLGGCDVTCDGLSACASGEVCCSNGCGAECELPVKRGRCPPIRGLTFGQGCIQNCAHDFECAGTAKCCTNGCALMCTEPRLEPSHCPYYGPGEQTCAPSPVSDCVSEADCSAGQLCCADTTCARICMDPAPCPHVDCPENPGPCPYGNRLDQFGCPTFCQCFDPCRNVICGEGTYCAILDISCSGSECIPYQLSCQECPYLICDNAASCPFGYGLDERGCRSCQCLNPCDLLAGGSPLSESRCFRGDPPCPDDYACMAAPDSRWAVCCPVGCVEAPCDLDCPFGLSVDGSGCQLCFCNPDPCLVPGCPGMESCVDTVRVQCPYPPCHPPYLPVCEMVCPELACPEVCGSSVLDAQGCETCQCTPQDIDLCKQPGCPDYTVCLGLKVIHTVAREYYLPKCQDICHMTPQVAPCQGRKARWTYDRRTKKCKKLKRGHCGTNPNAWSSRGNCRRYCETRLYRARKMAAAGF